MLVVAFKVVLPFPLACLQAPERCSSIYPCIAVSMFALQKCTRLSAQAFWSGTLHLQWLKRPEQGVDRCHQGPRPC